MCYSTTAGVPADITLALYTDRALGRDEKMSRWRCIDDVIGLSTRPPATTHSMFGIKVHKTILVASVLSKSLTPMPAIIT